MLLGAAALAAMLALAAPAQDGLPRNDGWVTDLARLLTPAQEQALEARMESYRQGSAHDIALLTLPDLGGEPIEALALRVARGWKLGSEETHDGALLVVSQGEREMRIEVGRGLEGTLTDAVCARILRDVITPRFRAGDFAGGLGAGVEALQRAAGGDYGALPAPAAPRDVQLPHPLLLLLPILLFVLVVVVAVKRAGARGRRRGGRSGGRSGAVWPWILVGDAVGRASRGGDGGGFGGLGGGGFGSGGFGGFGGGGGFSGGGASGKW